jgi:hypothetical protein
MPSLVRRRVCSITLHDVEAMAITVYGGERLIRLRVFRRTPTSQQMYPIPITVPPLPRRSYSVFGNVVAWQGHWYPSSILVELLDSLWVFGELVDLKDKWWLEHIKIGFHYLGGTIETHTDIPR